MPERLSCPMPWPDCRPGACECDGTYDVAKARGENPVEARNAFIRRLRRLTVTECEACDGRGYTQQWADERDD